MKPQFKALLIAILSLFTMVGQAQFKKVQFDPNVNINKEDIKINLVKKIDMKRPITIRYPLSLEL